MKSIALVLLITLTLLGCKNSDQKFSNAEVEETALDFNPSISARGYKMEESYAEQRETNSPMVIKTAYMSVEVDNYDAGRSKVDSLVKIYNARIVNENMQNYDYRKSNDFSIRVPAANLDKLQAALGAIAKRIDFQRVESTDVTEENIDVEARLNNQRRVEETFVKLLKKTDSVEEILKIESKLGEVRGQIESLMGRMKYLKNQSEYSTIHLTLYQKIDFKYEPEKTKPFSEQLKKALTMGWRGIVAIILIVIGLWPLWLLGAAVWGGIVIFRRRKKRVKLDRKIKKKDKSKEKAKGKDKEKDKVKPGIEPKNSEL